MPAADSIIVILDKPKHAQVALQRAMVLAREASAHLHLVSFCFLPMATNREVFDTHQRRALKKSLIQERRRWLDGLVRDSELAAADISTEIVWTDDIAGWVGDHAGRATRLVVKTVHHSRTLLHTPLDWALLRRCPVPLLLVSSAQPAQTGVVLAAVDAAAVTARRRRLDDKVVQAARWLVGLTGSKLHVVTVVEVQGSFEDLEYFDTRKVHSKARRLAAERLGELLAGQKVAQNRLHLPFGKVGQAVAEVAEQVQADTVVVGTGTRRGIGARLLGTSAEKILQRAACDVLAVHV